MSLLNPTHRRPLWILIAVLCGLLAVPWKRHGAGGAQAAPKTQAGIGASSHPLPLFRHILNSNVAMLLSPDGKTLVTFEIDGVKYWDTATRKLFWMRPWTPTPAASQTSSPSNLTFPCFWRAGNLYEYGIGQNILYCNDMRTNARIHAWPHAENYGYAADGSRLIRFGRTRHTPARVFDPVTGRRLGSFVPSAVSPDEATNSPVYFAPNGILSAMVVEGGRVMIWNIQTGALVRVLTDTRKYRYTHGLHGPVVFSPDERSVVTGAEDVTWKGPGDGPHSEASYAHSNYLISWDLRSGKPTRSVEANGNFGISTRISASTFSTDGKWLFDAGNRWQMPAFKLDPSASSVVWISCGGSTALLNRWSQKTFSVWDLNADQQRWTLPEPPLEIKACAFSADGLHLATADSRIRLWDLRTLQITQELPSPFPPDHLGFL